MTFLPQEIIRKKRSRQTLTGEEIGFFVKGITDGSIADAQTAALTMAIFLNGFSRDETRRAYAEHARFRRRAAMAGH